MVIEPRQAGQTLVCACGASLAAPTLRALTALEPAPPESLDKPASAAWGWKQRLRLLGALLLLAALVGEVWLLIARPTSRFDVIDPERIRQTAKTFAPSHSWDMWELMKKGLDRRTDQQYAAELDRFHMRHVAIALLAVAGAAMIAAGALGARRHIT
jgi:hypothetical protein